MTRKRIILLRHPHSYEYSSKIITENSRHNIEDRTTVPPYGVHLVYRVGRRTEVKPAMLNGTRRLLAINYASAIKRCVEKDNTRRYLIENGVPCPETTYDLRNLTGKYNGTDVPLLLRPRKHSRGREWYEFKNYQDFLDKKENLFVKKVLGSEGYYFSELLPIQEEVRMYMINGKIFCQSDKTNHRDGGEITHKYGYDSDYDEAYIIANRAAKILKIEVAGIDMIKSNGQWMVLEVNSAPSLNTEVLALRFTGVLDNHIDNIMGYGEMRRVPMFSFRQDDHDPSYIWV